MRSILVSVLSVTNYGQYLVLAPHTICGSERVQLNAVHVFDVFHFLLVLYYLQIIQMYQFVLQRTVAVWAIDPLI